MNNRTIVPMLASVALLALGATAAVQAQQASTMTFFLTSAGPGKGADLGGLEGADRLCQQLAQAGGAGGKTWRAYLSKQTALNEKGEAVNGRTETPNRHDVLTGSQPDGRAFAAGEDRTCGNWTKSGAGAAMVGHHDRQGLRDDDASKSWNSSHPSRGPDGGCSQADLKSTGGDGLFYCFAIN